MPAISMFYGIIIAISNGDILVGSIPELKMKLLQAWVEIHPDELMADWELAISGLNKTTFLTMQIRIK